MWCLLFTLAKLSGVFCPRWQKNVASFVHPGKNSLVSFGSGVFCPTFACPIKGGIKFLIVIEQTISDQILLKVSMVYAFNMHNRNNQWYSLVKFT